MRVLKPEWVGNDERPIFSVDIHPDGSRFATGGQGDNCGKVVIWNMAPIREDNEEKNDTVPKLLCQMEAHQSCVNCVKWSNDGKYLASGSDDKHIMIWQTSRYGVPSTVFGSSGKTVNVEQWRCAATLRAHDGDILDLAWSPNDAWLASCSVDNRIVIWNAHKFPEVLSVIKGHSSLVKGVCWDPVGKYLASQSDDKTLRIWRTHDWSQEACVSEPFKTTSGTTHILRLHWSPDGQYLVSAHAMNNSGPSAQIIERDGWRTNRDFVGHRKAITVARFNPFILTKAMTKSSGKEKAEKVTCCAIGSRDRSLSVWLTCLKRPLIVLHDLFTNSVLDVSWGRCGTELMACSWDGTIAYLKFDADEIGVPFSASEMAHFYHNVYGKSLTPNNMNGFHNGNANGNDPNAVVEDPEILRLQRQQELRLKEVAAAAVVASENQHSNGLPSAPKGPINKQIETRTKEGRRRITPLFLAPQPDLADTPLPFNSANITSTSIKGQSKIVVERKEDGSGKSNGDAQFAVKTPPGTPTSGDADVKSEKAEEASPCSVSLLSPPSPKPIDQDRVAEADKRDAGDPSAAHSTAAKNSSVSSSSTVIPAATTTDSTPIAAAAVLSNSVPSSKSVPVAGYRTDDGALNSTHNLEIPVAKAASLKRKNEISTSIALPAASAPSTGAPEKKKAKKDVMSRFNHSTSGTTTEGFAPPSITPAAPSPTLPTISTSVPKPLVSLPPVPPTISRPPPTPVSAASLYDPAQPQAPPIALRATRHPETAALHLPPPETPKAAALVVSVPRIIIPNALSSSSTSFLSVAVENHVPLGRSHVLHRLRVQVVEENPEKPQSSLSSSAAAPLAVWEQFFDRPILLTNASSEFVCVACDDSSLHLFSSATGTRLFPAIVIGSKASVLRAAGPFVMVLTVSAKLFLWCTRPLTSVIRNAALNPILKGGETISLEGSVLTHDGVPMLTVSSGKTFSFSAAMGCWIQVSGGVEDPLSQLSDHASFAYHPATAMPSNANCSDSRPLARAQRAARHRPSGTARHIFSSNVAKVIAGTPQSVAATLSHLENQVQAALALRSKEEFRFWLGTYVRFLAKESFHSKIRETFDMLLGPMPGDSAEDSGSNKAGRLNDWDPEILGISKHNLLSELLPTVGSQLSMQRLYAEYREHLFHLTSGKSMRETLFSKRH